MISTLPFDRMNKAPSHAIRQNPFTPNWSASVTSITPRLRLFESGWLLMHIRGLRPNTAPVVYDPTPRPAEHTDTDTIDHTSGNATAFRSLLILILLLIPHCSTPKQLIRSIRPRRHSFRSSGEKVAGRPPSERAPHALHRYKERGVKIHAPFPYPVGNNPFLSKGYSSL